MPSLDHGWTAHEGRMNTVLHQFSQGLRDAALAGRLLESEAEEPPDAKCREVAAG